ncbi:MAG: hypothetical protein WC835_02680 [Candidatus Paceibacterota bacterium]|jgi:hypothetical protein
MDEWDKIILAKSDISGVRSELVSGPVSIVPEEVVVKKEEKISPLKPAELRPATASAIPVFPAMQKTVSADAVIAPPNPSAIAPTGTLKKEETPAKALPFVGIISPYVSKLPALWGLDLAGKFATIALALAISFGVYSFSVHISNLGFKKTIAGTVDSVLTRVGGTSVLVASLFGGGNDQASSQLASPFAAVEVIDASNATTSEPVSSPNGANIATGTPATNTAKAQFESEPNLPIW